MTGTVTISDLDAGEVRRHAEDLATVLVDCVEGGASVSFMLPFDMKQARKYWRGVEQAVADGRAHVYAALQGEILGGTVQLWLDTPDNQRHRGDIRKLLVHRSVRRVGLATRLMLHAETEARRLGLSLLTLDTVTASPAQKLYETLGWHNVGVIPRFALWPDGRFCDATILYKEIG